jgi:hypothetical protein
MELTFGAFLLPPRSPLKEARDPDQQSTPRSGVLCLKCYHPLDILARLSYILARLSRFSLRPQMGSHRANVFSVPKPIDRTADT